MSGQPTGWSRRRLLVLLAAGVVLLVGLAVGLAATVLPVLRGQTPTAAAGPGLQGPSPAAAGGGGQGRRDAIAAAPMRPSTPTEGRPGRPAASPPPVVLVPPATTTDALGVPTGFPRTAAGALGQLGALGSSVLGRASVDDAHAVYRAWARPGGVGAARWRLARDVATFLDAAGPQAVLLARPVAAQVKGVDGPDWLVGCVLLELSAPTVPGRSAQVAYGYCERLTWDRDRWVIGPGAAPAEPPHTWPGTQAAAQAGWRTWVEQAGE
jgi:hypothetical protein